MPLLRDPSGGVAAFGLPFTLSFAVVCVRCLAMNLLLRSDLTSSKSLKPDSASVVGGAPSTSDPARLGGRSLNVCVRIDLRALRFASFRCRSCRVSVLGPGSAFLRSGLSDGMKRKFRFRGDSGIGWRPPPGFRWGEDASRSSRLTRFAGLSPSESTVRSMAGDDARLGGLWDLEKN